MRSRSYSSRTGKPGAPQSTGSQRVGHNLVTEQQQCFTTLPSTLVPSLPITTCPCKAYLPNTHLSLLPSSLEDRTHISFPVGNCSNVFVVYHFAWTSSSKSGYTYLNPINSTFYILHLYVYVCVIYNYMGHYMKWFFPLWVVIKREKNGRYQN